MSLPDYQKLIGSQMQAFIEKSQAYYPSNSTDQTIHDQRIIYEKLCLAFNYGRPAGVKSHDEPIQHIPVRHYLFDEAGAESSAKVNLDQTEQRLIVYFHGGGFVLGGLESHDDICSEICAKTGYGLVSVGYRLAPEHPHPAMFNDALQATRFLIENTDVPLILCGDSSGGNLAAAVAHSLRYETERIIGQLLIYPSLRPTTGRGSYKRHAMAPMLTTSDVKFFIRSRCGQSTGYLPDDKTLFPLLDNNFCNLPPTVIMTADCDPLRDDGRDYRAQITAAGGKVLWVNEEGLVHGFLRARKEVQCASLAFVRMIDLILMLGKNNWVLGKSKIF